MNVDPKLLGVLAGHNASALEMIRTLLTRHDLGPNARGIVEIAERELIEARKILSALVEKANPPTPVEEKFGSFQ